MAKQLQEPDTQEADATVRVFPNTDMSFPYSTKIELILLMYIFMSFSIQKDQPRTTLVFLKHNIKLAVMTKVN